VGRDSQVLTDRQREISRLLAYGRSNKEIANDLGISRRTVEDHRSAIYDKMGVRNVVELTRKILGVE
jgi:two-component system response regulator DctR